MATYKSVSLDPIRNPELGDEEVLHVKEKKSKQERAKEVTMSLNKFFNRTDNDLDFVLDNTCDPEFIIWKNQGVTTLKRRFNKIRNIIIMVLIVVLTFYSLKIYKGERAQIYTKIMPVLGKAGFDGLNCQSLQLTSMDALNSINLLQKSYDIGQYGDKENGRTTIEMWCFCQNLLYTKPLEFFDYEFSDSVNHCNDWWEDFKTAMLWQYSPIAMVQFINVLSTFLFIWLASLEQ